MRRIFQKFVLFHTIAVEQLKSFLFAKFFYFPNNFLSSLFLFDAKDGRVLCSFACGGYNTLRRKRTEGGWERRDRKASGDHIEKRMNGTKCFHRAEVEMKVESIVCEGGRGKRKRINLQALEIVKVEFHVAQWHCQFRNGSQKPNEFNTDV